MIEKTRSKSTLSAVELRPDGWGRFERAVNAALHMPPQHRAAKKPARSVIKQKRKR